MTIQISRIKKTNAQQGFCEIGAKVINLKISNSNQHL